MQKVDVDCPHFVRVPQLSTGCHLLGKTEETHRFLSEKPPLSCHLLVLSVAQLVEREIVVVAFEA